MSAHWQMGTFSLREGICSHTNTYTHAHTKRSSFRHQDKNVTSPAMVMMNYYYVPVLPLKRRLGLHTEGIKSSSPRFQISAMNFLTKSLVSAYRSGGNNGGSGVALLPVAAAGDDDDDGDDALDNHAVTSTFCCRGAGRCRGVVVVVAPTVTARALQADGFCSGMAAFVDCGNDEKEADSAARDAASAACSCKKADSSRSSSSFLSSVNRANCRAAVVLAAAASNGDSGGGAGDGASMVVVYNEVSSS